MGFSIAESQAILDQRFPTTGATDYLMWSTNGTSEFTGLPRQFIGSTGWAAATAADPSVKANANAGTTGGATQATSAGSPVAWVAVVSAATGGTQRTDWQQITDGQGNVQARALLIGDQLSYAPGAIRITLT